MAEEYKVRVVLEFDAQKHQNDPDVCDELMESTVNRLKHTDREELLRILGDQPFRVNEVYAVRRMDNTRVGTRRLK